MSEHYDMIVLYITQVTNVDRMQELYYLRDKHNDVIIAADIFLKKRKGEDIAENPLWMLIENNGKGIYLASKIYKKFKPWISMGKATHLYFHEFPEQLKEMDKWDPKKEEQLMKIRI